jgi:hypothetical protein
MSLEEYTPDESVWESWWASNEKASEISEKFKEQVRKAGAWIKRTQKDEWKAKKQDMLLASFLVKLIISKKFDYILDLLFKLLDKWYSSNFLLGILSLIYPDISDRIRETSNLEKINFNYKESKLIEFDDSSININIKNRINFWVEDIILSSTSDYSHLLTSRLIDLIKKDDDDVLEFISTVFAFFLKETNISIHKDEAINISKFILSEVFRKIKTLNIEDI